jgi:hypothetical protein
MKGQHFFAVGIGILLLALVVACNQVPVVEPETNQPAPVEVVVPQTEVQSLPIETETTPGSAFYAANPELKILLYTGSLEKVDIQPDDYDIELLRAQSYAVFREKNSLDIFLEANPELRFARNRLATVTEEGVDSTFLATNPELMVARRYAAQNEIE